MKEVFDVAVSAFGIDDRQTAGFTVGVCGDGANLGEQSSGMEVELFWIGRTHQTGVETATGIDHGGEDGHGVSGDGEAFEVVAHVFVEVGILGEQFREPGKLLAGGEFTVDDQVGDFDEGGFFGELFDGVAAVQQDTLAAVDESNL